MPDVHAWESIARHARRHGRDATRFDAMDLYLEGFPTAIVTFCVLAYVDDDVTHYWTGRGVIDVHGDAEAALATSTDPGEAELFVSAEEARDEAWYADLVVGRELRVRALVR